MLLLINNVLVIFIFFMLLYNMVFDAVQLMLNVVWQEDSEFRRYMTFLRSLCLLAKMKALINNDENESHRYNSSHSFMLLHANGTN